jgi:hypothetical protein
MNLLTTVDQDVELAIGREPLVEGWADQTEQW